MVWLYQGAWAMLLNQRSDQVAILAEVPVMRRQPTLALAGLGTAECLVALWVLTGWRRREAAVFQTLAVSLMNAGGLLYGRDQIRSVPRLLAGNGLFLCLAWWASR
jgi:hypothetical protein